MSISCTWGLCGQMITWLAYSPDESVLSPGCPPDSAFCLKVYGESVNLAAPAFFLSSSRLMTSSSHPSLSPKHLPSTTYRATCFSIQPYSLGPCVLLGFSTPLTFMDTAKTRNSPNANFLVLFRFSEKVASKKPLRCRWHLLLDVWEPLSFIFMQNI